MANYFCWNIAFGRAFFETHSEEESKKYMINDKALCSEAEEDEESSVNMHEKEFRDFL